MWKFQHLDGQNEINELHVPVGRSVKLVKVASVLGTTAMATRQGDATLYVANQGGVVGAIRSGRVPA